MAGTETQVRHYVPDEDYERVNEFLVDLYQAGDSLVGWLQPRWEYMHFHSNVGDVDLSRIGIVDSGGDMVGLVHPEHSMALVYLQVRPGHYEVADSLIDHAIDNFGGAIENFGGRSETLAANVLGIFCSDFDPTLVALMADRGFRFMPDLDEPASRFVVCGSIDPAPLPAGFSVVSLAEHNDLTEINRVLWRGFNHQGPPPAEGIESRRRAQQAPNFDRSLTMVAVAPNGDYASFSGMWLDPVNRVAYVEPVATDPAYRRKGLAAAAVLESMHRVAAKGAEVIWVGSDQDFYKSLGFANTCRNVLLVKDL